MRLESDLRLLLEAFAWLPRVSVGVKQLRLGTHQTIAEQVETACERLRTVPDEVIGDCWSKLPWREARERIERNSTYAANGHEGRIARESRIAIGFIDAMPALVRTPTLIVELLLLSASINSDGSTASSD